jgi:hypothetical protein
MLTQQGTEQQKVTQQHINTSAQQQNRTVADGFLKNEEYNSWIERRNAVQKISYFAQMDLSMAHRLTTAILHRHERRSLSRGRDV